MDTVKKILSNPVLMAIVKISFILYSSKLAPASPSQWDWFFQHSIVRIGILALMLFLSKLDLQMAIIIAVVYVVGMNTISGRKILESFANFDKQIENNPKVKLLEPKTVIHPGCLDVTMNDLLPLFDNDKLKLQDNLAYSFKVLLEHTQNEVAKDKLMRIAYAAGLPYNIEFTDEHAPYIATILIYAGFVVNPKCKLV